MAEKDLSEKILLNYNDVFADIVNGLLFEGKDVINPKTLEDKLVHAQYKAEDGVLHEEERDVFKKICRDFGIEIALCGLENQTEPFKFMPARIIGYDGAAYRAQLLNKGIKKIVPVITLVLNFSMTQWNEPLTLKELLDIPDGLVEYVNDYKIHVFNVAWLSDAEIEKFKSDFKIVANFFSKKRLYGDDYIPDDPSVIEHVDAVLKLLAVMTGDRRYELPIPERKEVSTMCDVAQRLEERGVAKGRTEGMDRVSKLVNFLAKQGKTDEILKVTSDPKYRDQMLKTFNM